MFKKGLLLSTTALLLSACGETDEAADDNTNEKTEETVTIRVASHLPPMTDVVEIAGDAIEEGYEVELVEVSDNIQYNEALLNEEVDANFAQHEPFMEMFNKERDGNLVAIQPIYNAIVGFYSPVYDSVSDIEKGAEVAIPSDPTNEARALVTLEEHELITLDPDVNKSEVTDTDVVENPHDFTFTHVDLLNLTAAYEDGVELVFNYPTYIANIDLTPEDAIVLQADEENRFAQTLIARADNQGSEEIQALVDAMTSQEVYDFLDELSENGHLRPAFEVSE
ncbi:MAG: MetQ/NlpA family ABC transporter substrate-binding protein [Alkalibacterium gilvum]|uniref:D-methionine transport system substrate-binding protein n=1 Tax=Alkalibacterium gilvum TaxID=1130080 RepID=A0A1H6S9W1_9LACT|nr:MULTISPECIES: MetQ/NlpA family ABC transporter substrate-binding protein [Alkalibacterium]MDN6194177.1 MetQ/NlpA family ABC transporter substrate-binding protein [Alkalibacterium sp.]MDN6294641.1 MetQ/NlpA family ABC transporter substrate-binding protein [Alkalibacterium sp.]MDN6296299.1 MetQ/NlpA family ABC transporter substrate-binding protein [Alkalibacterium sp.]MDN6398686.1 MetQ/NlpA family ABC transporter substrate-binding protein [Alkalibacterium sp.]MDN6730435.1 MetQ/NlpA family ABC